MKKWELVLKIIAIVMLFIYGYFALTQDKPPLWALLLFILAMLITLTLGLKNFNKTQKK